MHQIAIRLPDTLLSEVDAIIASRRGGYGRTAVIRELLWEAIDRRKGTKK